MKHRPGKHRRAIAAVIGGLLLVGGMAQGAETRKSYKWIDKNGVTHYGDTIPPEYAAQGHEELNKQGVPVRETARQLTPAEAAEAQKIAAEKQRRQQHDSFLLSTYTRAADIEQLRDERLGLVQAQLDIARGSLTSIGQRIATLERRMGGFKPYSTAANARRVPDQLAEEAVRTLSEQRSMQTTVDQRQKEMADLRAEFDADIARYRELTSRPASR